MSQCPKSGLSYRLPPERSSVRHRQERLELRRPQSGSVPGLFEAGDQATYCGGACRSLGSLVSAMARSPIPPGLKGEGIMCIMGRWRTRDERTASCLLATWICARLGAGIRRTAMTKRLNGVVRCPTMNRLMTFSVTSPTHPSPPPLECIPPVSAAHQWSSRCLTALGAASVGDGI